MKISKSLVALGLAALLSACGGGSTGSTERTTAPLPINTFNGILVPPDPGAAANATVAGVDTDHNGIRDEIDRYIAQKYGADLTKFAAAQALAKVQQLLLITPATDVNAATAALYADTDARFCAVRKFPNDQNAVVRLIDDIVAQTFNTKNRQKQFQAIGFKVGQFTRSTEGVICP